MYNQSKRVALVVKFIFKNEMLLLRLLLNCFFVTSVLGGDLNEPPKLLIVSFGGLRWDYLNNLTDLENFNYLKNYGAYAEYINPGFLTESLPSQWSIVTGTH